jgi:dTDP-4-amino-4,6-dideoxygalactose transaminase
MIKFQNLRPSKELQVKLESIFTQFLESGHYVLGSKVVEFEEKFSRFCNSKYCIGVGNGLDALKIILKAYNIGKGDEVIVASNTYIATWLAVTEVGAKIVPVEPDLKTFNLNPKLIQQKISKNTKAILTTSLYGRASVNKELIEVAKENNIYLFEDAAQSHGAIIDGMISGGSADASAFSFYPTKNLGCFGDGGAITTNDKEIYQACKKIRNYGSSKRYFNEIIGCNSRLDEIQASFLLLKLNEIEEVISHRAKIASFYINEITNPLVDLPSCDGLKRNDRHVWHLFVIRSNHREKLSDFLISRGIETLIHYPIPPHKQAAYSKQFLNKSFPISEEMHRTVLSLPIGEHIKKAEMKKIAKTINNFYV